MLRPQNPGGPIRSVSDSRGCGEIGRRARFRSWCRKTCRFKSCHPHKLVTLLRLCVQEAARFSPGDGEIDCAMRAGLGNQIASSSTRTTPRTVASPCSTKLSARTRPSSLLGIALITPIISQSTSSCTTSWRAPNCLVAPTWCGWPCYDYVHTCASSLSLPRWRILRTSAQVSRGSATMFRSSAGSVTSTSCID